MSISKSPSLLLVVCGMLVLFGEGKATFAQNLTVKGTTIGEKSSYFATESGKVGIGTTTPRYKLDVANGNISIDNIAGYLLSDPNGNPRYGLSYFSTAHLWLTNRAAGGDLVLAANGGRDGSQLEGIRILSRSGNVGIGTKTPNERLHVAGKATADEWLTNSDVRLKRNVHRVEDALEKVSRINGVTWTWGDPGIDSYERMGVIAQDVEHVAPQLVSTRGDHKAVNYDGLNALTIEAIKELRARVEQLEAGQAACEQH